MLSFHRREPENPSRFHGDPFADLIAAADADPLVSRAHKSYTFHFAL